MLDVLTIFAVILEIKFNFNCNNTFKFLSDLKNQTIVSSCVTHILPSCGYFKSGTNLF